MCWEMIFHSMPCSSSYLFMLLFSDECFVKPCSSKATSVIRLASQKSPKPSSSSSASSTNASSIASTPTPINIVRPAGNRQSVKKLVVKLKKPFVPVIEEEANLHPPGEFLMTCWTQIINWDKITDWSENYWLGQWWVQQRAHNL